MHAKEGKKKVKGSKTRQKQPFLGYFVHKVGA
jgi:hypothetical protein